MSITFLDFFSGIGGFRRGMELAGHKCKGHCEIDKFANMSYVAMHNPREDEWFGTDIKKVRADELPRVDCWCFGFPCQDISVAGKQLGFRGNRSSLFFTVTRLIRDTKEEDRPKYLFIENVKNLLSVNGGADFLKLLIELDEIGYDAEWQIINSRDYVPQNRERVFIIGHLRGRSGRKVFPIEGGSKEIGIKQVGNTVSTGNWNNPQRGRIYSFEGICPALNCMRGGGLEPKIMVTGNVNPSGNGMNGQVYNSVGLSPTLTTNKGEGYKILVNNFRIRKLTPKECFRLQGWSDEYFERAASVCSDSQLYKQAGNGVTVNVIYEIAKRIE